MTAKAFQGKTQLARRAILCFALATALIRPVAGQSASNQRPALMDRNKEIALALSACPPSVAGKAAVYVLDHAGYIKVRRRRERLHGDRPARRARQSGPAVHGRRGHAHVPSALSEGG